MTIFLSGGCKNGKSTFAEGCAQALAGDGPLYYVATMIPHDDEDLVRIARHVAERAGKGFTTLEQGTRLCDCLKRADPSGTFLLDSVTALLSNEMFPPMTMDMDAGARVASELREFASRVENAVFVSDFLYSDALPYDEYTERYRAALALCDRTLAGCCDCAAEVALGTVLCYKGAPPL